MTTAAIAADRLELGVDGMTCSGCVARLERALTTTPGIEDASVNLPLERASVHIDPQAISFEDVFGVVRDTGFEVRTDLVKFKVTGIASNDWSDQIRSNLLSVPGVLEVSVDQSRDQIDVSIVDRVTNASILIASAAIVGYELKEDDSDETPEFEWNKKFAEARRDATYASLLTLPLVLQMIAQFLGWERIHLMPSVEVVLATPVQLWFGWRFYKAAFNALRSGGTNMEVLVALGTTAAYLYSWYLMISLGELAEGELYFEASAVIISLVMWGKYFEARAKKRTSEWLEIMNSLRPRTARVLLNSGDFAERSIKQVDVGDIVRCLPGDHIPADGRIQSGTASIDESLVTGESQPVVLKKGSRVLEGTTNLDGMLDIEVTSRGEDSTLNKIARLVEQAQLGKASIQRAVDRVCGIFVPIVVAIAILTLGVWMILGSGFEIALINAVSVLVIACPCALGLATPTAVMVGTGVAARAGILFRDIEALETGYRINHVVFDKTGTLTEGKPQITSIEVVENPHIQDSDQLLRRVATVQTGSEHPIAGAFLDLAENRDVDLGLLTEFRAHVGEGVEGVVDGATFLAGNKSLMHKFEISLKSQDKESENFVWLANDGELVGVASFEDRLRPQSGEAVTGLKSLGVEVHILSGDSNKATEPLASYLGVDSYWAECTPDSKVDHVKNMKQPGSRIAMVGDGINDAPALAEADLSIAMSTGTEVAMEVAQVTLDHPDPSLVSATLDVSRRTFNKIHQNLFWAFIYNVTMIPLACLGYLNPAIAGAAMAFSSVSVVLNSLLLNRWRRK